MREDAERIARNEDAYRKRNEMLRLGQGTEGRLFLLCECGAAACSAPVHLTPDEYEAVRADSRRFAVVPGHEMAHVEQVVEEHPKFAVVEKVEEAGSEADRLDPR